MQALKNAVLAYSDAVFKSDDRPDRCRKAADDYANQHRVTVPAPPVSYRHGPSLADKTDWSGSSKTWDSRTRNSAPIVLAVVSGPYYALSLVVHGSELRIHNLDGQGTIVRVALA